jgi:hypothetical protein
MRTHVPNFAPGTFKSYITDYIHTAQPLSAFCVGNTICSKSYSKIVTKDFATFLYGRILRLHDVHHYLPSLIKLHGDFLSTKVRMTRQQQQGITKRICVAYATFAQKCMQHNMIIDVLEHGKPYLEQETLAERITIAAIMDLNCAMIIHDMVKENLRLLG